jgi:Fe-S cluster biosynthesis and repair protein YggX
MTDAQYFEILEKAIDAFEAKGGTPEELGSLIFDATKRVIPDGWQGKNDTFIKDRQSEKANAIKRILELPHGKEILLYEEKAIYKGN